MPAFNMNINSPFVYFFNIRKGRFTRNITIFISIDEKTLFYYFMLETRYDLVILK